MPGARRLDRRAFGEYFGQDWDAGLLDRKLGGLAGLSARARHALARLGVTTLRQLLQVSAGQLRTLRGIGEGTVDNVVAVLETIDEGRSATAAAGDRPALDLDAGLSTQLLLQARSLTVLRRGGVERVRDLLALTPEQVLELPGAGQTTLKDIAGALDQHGLQLSCSSPSRFGEVVVREWTAEALQAPLERLPLGGRARNRLQRLQCRTVGDVLRVAEEDVSRLYGAGPGTVSEIREALRTVDLAALAAAAGPKGFAPGIWGWVERLEAGLGPRGAEVLRARYDLSSGEILTQAQTAAQLGISRQRVDQCQKRIREEARRAPSSREMMADVLAAIDHQGGLASVDEIAEALQRREPEATIAWRAVAELLAEAHPELEGVQRGRGPFGRAGCREKAERVRAHWRLDATDDNVPGVPRPFVTACRRLLPPRAPRRRQSRYEADIAAIFAAAAGPLHYRTVADALSRLAGRLVRPENVHSILRRLPGYVRVERGVFAPTAWDAGQALRRDRRPIADVATELLTEAGGHMSAAELLAELSRRKQMRETAIQEQLASDERFAQHEEEYVLVGSAEG